MSDFSRKVIAPTLIHIFSLTLKLTDYLQKSKSFYTDVPNFQQKTAIFTQKRPILAVHFLSILAT
jgi:hypothetical protein